MQGGMDIKLAPACVLRSLAVVGAELKGNHCCYSAEQREHLFLPVLRSCNYIKVLSPRPAHAYKDL